jgi:hypothetical protein
MYLGLETRRILSPAAVAVAGGGASDGEGTGGCSFVILS